MLTNGRSIFSDHLLGDKMKQFKLLALTACALFVLSGCGGGDSVTPPANQASPASFVAGDSLVDVGVFGARFTVQSSNAAKPNLVWPELISNGFNLGKLCAAYSGAAFTPVANCSGYGVGGAQINPVKIDKTGGFVSGATIGSDTNAMSIIQQITDMANGRAFGSKDLILIDGGGNDINALATSLLEGLGGNPAAIPAYKKVLKDLLPTQAATIDAAATPTDLVNLGGAYMQVAATMLANAIKTKLITSGAQRIVVLNVPNLSRTPDLISQAAAHPALNGWALAFNNKLTSELGSESAKVEIVNFYGLLDTYTSNPGSAAIGAVSLSNVTSKACGTTNVTACTDTLLDASGPTGWRTYLFADGLHSTPFGNELLAQSVRSAITAKGWTY
jgi:outer membrane lipase/esterase